MFGWRRTWQVAKYILFVGIAGLVLSAAQSLPQGLIQQLNRVSPNQTLTNPAQPLVSPLDQAREGKPSAARHSPAMAFPLKRSDLERDYSRRAGTTLTQFGYDTFRTIIPSTGEIQNGAVSDNYHLNIGDELIITLRGNVSRSIKTRVDREGRVVIPELPPIAAAGVTFGRFRDELEHQVAKVFINTQVFVSLGAVRQIAVSVLGEANAPGIYRMGGFATVLDALAMAGGVKKTGSLRHIRLTRRGVTTTIDLYDLLVGIPGRSDFSLADGDRIVIPPIGPTVAIAGAIDRPGIYEMSSSRRMTGRQIAQLAGSPLQPTGNHYVKLSLDRSGRDRTIHVPSFARATLGPGDILVVTGGNGPQVGSVRLEGHVRVPGIRPLSRAPDVRTLIGSYDAFRNNPYLLFGAIQRTDPSTRARILIPINLDAIIKGKENVPLRDDDTVIVLGVRDVNYVGSSDVQAVLRGESPPSAANTTESPPSARNTTESPASARNAADRSTKSANVKQICRGLQLLTDIVNHGRAGRFANAIVYLGEGAGGGVSVLPNDHCPKIFDEYPALLPLVVEHVAALQGEVHVPGLYPVVAGTPLSAVVTIAGGLSRDVDLQRVEVSHYAINNAKGYSKAIRNLVRLEPGDMNRLAVSPGDVIRFNPVYIDRDNGPVVLTGEFRNPGIYQIHRGERLSSVIARAGGLDADAYPYGAVFTRLSIKAKERSQLIAAANQVEAGLTTALAHTQSSTSQNPQALIEATQLFAKELRTSPVAGRMVVEADPTVLKVKPQLDVILEPGDHIFMPKRPSTVAVSGEVLHPTSLQFVSGESPSGYIRQAGGFTESANEDATFVVLPNGQAESLGVSFWNYNPIMLPPGSTIVVPKELYPFDLTKFLQNSTQILSNLAISAASLAVLHSTSTR